jgi:hypothetical protein
MSAGWCHMMRRQVSLLALCWMCAPHDVARHASWHAAWHQQEVKTIAGGAQKGFADGVGQRARFNCPTGIAVGSYGDVYVAGTSIL